MPPAGGRRTNHRLQRKASAGASLNPLVRHLTHWRITQQLSLPARLPQDRFVRNATQLYRSDFFPGLGWMLNTRVWHSVRDTWCAASCLPSLMRPWAPAL